MHSMIDQTGKHCMVEKDITMKTSTLEKTKTTILNKANNNNKTRNGLQMTTEKYKFLS